MAYNNPSAGIGFNFIRGSATITAGDTFVDVSVPNIPPERYTVLVVPTISLSALWFVSNKTSTSFRINLTTAQSLDITFDYVIIYQ